MSETPKILTEKKVRNFLALLPVMQAEDSMYGDLARTCVALADALENYLRDHGKENQWMARELMRQWKGGAS